MEKHIKLLYCRPHTVLKMYNNEKAFRKDQFKENHEYRGSLIKLPVTLDETF